jgi:4-amino-4-deoxy-L-arabinose transferase-like glycosyltransferase
VRPDKRRFHLRVALAFVALVLTIYLIGVPRTPPGFCLDESSIAFNAHLISTSGHDEYSEAWPLFFKAFGEYKNPIYIYLLAALFKLTGPSITVARILSAALGIGAVLLIAYLAAAISKRWSVGLVVGLSTAFTPWIFENSRLVFEVACYPTLTALFLIAVFRAAKHERWSAIDVLSLIATLALLTYGYSIGRLLGPLFAIGLIIFASRKRHLEILFVWVGYALSLIPLFVFSRHHPGALTARFSSLTYIQPNTTVRGIAQRFITQYAQDINPMRFLLIGEDNVRDHLAGTGSILAVTFIFALVGLILVLRHQRRERWWLFVIYASVISVIPAALTTTIFPQIRLITLPVLINVLSIPAWQFLFERVRFKERSRGLALLIASLVLMMAQGFYFQVLYHQKAPERGYVCDEKFPRKVLAVALASLQSPIYLLDEPGQSGYVQSDWHGLLGGISPARFLRIDNPGAAPPGTVVISTAETCANCRLLARHLNFIVYTPLPSKLQPRYGPLADEAFRSEIQLAGSLPTFRAGEQRSVTVLVRNVSPITWPSVGDDDGRYALTVRSRWLRPDGTVVSNSPESKPIYYGLDPGDVAGITLPVNAPASAGEYQLVIDVVQEGVGWFSEKGSKALIQNVSVNNH